MRNGRSPGELDALTRATRRNLYSLLRLLDSLSLNVARRIPRSENSLHSYAMKVSQTLACLASFQKVLLERLLSEGAPPPENSGERWFEELAPALGFRRKYATSARTGEKRLAFLLDKITDSLGLLDYESLHKLPPSPSELWEFHALVTSVVDQLAWFVACSLAFRMWPEHVPRVS